MKRVKGCLNNSCIAKKKKTKYKANDEYCLKCGSKLQYVCKECFTVISDPSKNLCVRCIAKKADNNDGILKKGAAAVAVIPVVAVGVKEVAKALLKK